MFVLIQAKVPSRTNSRLTAVPGRLLSSICPGQAAVGSAERVENQRRAHGQNRSLLPFCYLMRCYVALQSSGWVLLIRGLQQGLQSKRIPPAVAPGPFKLWSKSLRGGLALADEEQEIPKISASFSACLCWEDAHILLLAFVAEYLTIRRKDFYLNTKCMLIIKWIKEFLLECCLPMKLKACHSFFSMEKKTNLIIYYLQPPSSCRPCHFICTSRLKLSHLMFCFCQWLDHNMSDNWLISKSVHHWAMHHLMHLQMVDMLRVKWAFCS